MADFDKSKHPMATIKGKGNKFVKKGSAVDKGIDEEKITHFTNLYSDDPARDTAEYGERQHKPQKIVILPKQEYAEFCSAIRTKYADRIPKKGHLLYGKNYYRFKYDRKSERILCTFKMPIVGNEDLIKEIMWEE